mgnify:CR=1 FL=1
MTSNPTRRTVLTGTAASALAAAVPASAAVAEQRLTPNAEEFLSMVESRIDGAKQDAIWHLSRQMPADPRTWIDTARAAGFTVEIGHVDGKAGVVTGYHEVPAEVRDFLQAWGAAIPTDQVVAELQDEGLGPNDRRLTELATEYQTVCQANTGDVTPRERAIMDELLSTPADSPKGVAAKLWAVEPTRAMEPDAPADKLEHRALSEIVKLGGFQTEGA